MQCLKQRKSSANANKQTSVACEFLQEWNGFSISLNTLVTLLSPSRTERNESFFLWLVPSRYSRRRCAITIVHIVFITFSKENACLFPRASVIQYSWMIMLSARRWIPWQTAKDGRKMKSLGSRGFRGQETTLSSTCFFDCLGLDVPNMDSPPEPAHVHNRRLPFRSLPVRLKASRSQCFNIDWQSNQRREETLRYGAFGITTLWFSRAQGIKQVPTRRQTAMAMHT